METEKIIAVIDTAFCSCEKLGNLRTGFEPYDLCDTGASFVVKST